MATKAKKVTLLTVCVGMVVVLVTVGLYWGEIVVWYRLHRDFERLPANEQGYPEYRHRQTGIVFVRVPGGKFWMGSTKAEADQHVQNVVVLLGQAYQSREREFVAVEQPRHRVALSPFLIAKYEVSQVHWENVMGSNPSQFKGNNLPVERVHWKDCQEFCEKTGLRLPTEAQWEYACRAGTTTPFAFGATVSTDQVNYNGHYPYDMEKKEGPVKGLLRRALGLPYVVKRGVYRSKTVSVDSFRPNAFGLYNMHGNVWEWCADVYDPNYYGRPVTANGDKACISGSEHRVRRGGGWDVSARCCRSAFRAWGLWVRLNDTGYRPVYNLKPEPPRRELRVSLQEFRIQDRGGTQGGRVIAERDTARQTAP